MLLRIFCLLSLLPLAACSGSPTENRAKPGGVLAALANPDRVELIALHPYPHQIKEDEQMDRMHGYGVLGRAVMSDDASANTLLAGIEIGIIEASDGLTVDCFNPRHGLRATVGQTLWELVICYECRSMQVYRDGEHVDGHTTVERTGIEVTAVFEAAGLTIHTNE